jgi:hypothetical protein
MDNLSYKFTFNSLGINIGPTPGANQDQLQNNLVASDTASFSRGRQLIRFGGEYDGINLDKSFPQEFNGQLFFSPSSGYTDFQPFLMEAAASTTTNTAPATTRCLHRTT